MNIIASFPTNSQSAVAVEPGNRSFDNPPCLAESASVLSIPFREDRFDTQPSQDTTYGFTVVAAIPLHPFGPLTWSAAPTFDGRKVCRQPNDFHHVVSIRLRNADDQWNSLRICDHVMFAAKFATIRRTWPCFLAPTDRSHQTTVDDAPRPVEFVGRIQFRKQRLVKPLPDAELLPVTKTTPTCHTTAAKLTRQVLPANSRLEHVEDSFQNHPIVNRLSAAFSPHAVPRDQDGRTTNGRRVPLPRQ